MVADYQKTHFAVMNVTYTYLNDGYTIVVTTDTPCHLYCRMTDKPPWKHKQPSFRRGLYIIGDVRFCFTVYEDNDQLEAGDTTTHTFIKDGWKVCEDRWFYFVGTIDGLPVESQSAIFQFHFPAPPPPMPEYMAYTIIGSLDNRSIEATSATWQTAHDARSGWVRDLHDPPWTRIMAGSVLTATHFIWRGFLDFDTSILPDTAKVLYAALSLYVILADFNDLPRPNIYVTDGVQHYPPIPADYGDQLPFTTIIGEKDGTTFNVPAYNDIDLNETGLDHVETTRKTRYCLRSQNDINDRGAGAIYNSWFWFFSAQHPDAVKPLLKINYYPAVKPC